MQCRVAGLASLPFVEPKNAFKIVFHAYSRILCVFDNFVQNWTKINYISPELNKKNLLLVQIWTKGSHLLLFKKFNI